jgi:endonuclease/exonuclease/phosphatase family metal-dependent hydrolase
MHLVFMKRSLPLLLAAALGALVAQGLSAQSYRVLTYNLGLLRVLGSDWVPIVEARARVAPRELARFVQASSPQIVMLEEVWNERHAQAIEKELEPLGYTFIRPTQPSLLGLSAGLLLAIKSPLSVVDWKFTRFTKSTFLDSLTGKGVLEVTLQDPTNGNLQFAVVGTHTVALDTAKGEAKDQKQVEAFTTQAKEILAAVQRRSENGRLPTLLMGDFNVGPGYADAQYRQIADSGSLVEAGASLYPSSPLISWDPQNPLVKYGEFPLEPPAKIDHVFMQNGTARSWTATSARLVFNMPVDDLSLLPPKAAPPVSTPLSDHYGFLADVELSTAK